MWVLFIFPCWLETIEQFFMSLFIICISWFENCLLISLSYFLIFLVSLFLNFLSYLQLLINKTSISCMHNLHIFSPVFLVVFSLYEWLPLQDRGFLTWCNFFLFFFLRNCASGVFSKQPLFIFTSCIVSASFSFSILMVSGQRYALLK